jgi:hypothetical protein
MLARCPTFLLLWRVGRHVGLVEPDHSGLRLPAVAPDFWADNAVHLPQ